MTSNGAAGRSPSSRSCSLWCRLWRSRSRVASSTGTTPALVLAVSTLVACLSVGMIGLIETPLQAVVLYGVVFGAATACTSVPAIGVMISRSFPDRMGLANGVAVSGSGIGQLLIVLALTARIEDWGWRGSFVALGIAGAILVLPMTYFAVAPRDHGAAQRSTVTGQLTATDALPLRSIVALATVLAAGCDLRNLRVPGSLRGPACRRVRARPRRRFAARA